MKQLITAFLTLGIACATTAAPLVQSASPISGATNTVTFEEAAPPPDNTPVTNQFAGLGITFSGTSNGPTSGLYMNPQGSGSFDSLGIFDGNYIGSYNSPVGGLSGTVNAVTIDFSSLVTAASFAYYTNGASVTMEAFNGASLVDSVTQALPFPGASGGLGFWGFAGGSAFDRIVITSTAGVVSPQIDGAAIFDSFAFTTLAAPGGAPEINSAQALLPCLCSVLLLLIFRRNPS